MKKKRVKTNVYIILMLILLACLPFIDYLNNKIITLIYYIIQIIIIIKLYKRIGD